nr:hypothetical protein [Tanacetum cinerariifolium]
MASKISAQDLEISNLKAQIKLLEDKDKGTAELSRDDAPIKGRSLETGEEAGVEKSTERGKSDTSKKKKLQEQIGVQMAREIEEQMARSDQRMDEQIARDAEIAEIHTEEELQMLIDGLDRNNKQQREFYMSVLISHSGWKTKHFKGMTLEEVREKFILVWKQIKDFVPMSSTEEGKRMKRKGLRLEHESAKKMKTSEGVSKEDWLKKTKKRTKSDQNRTKTGSVVKNKREKDKIGTKPDQIKKKREAWRSPEKSRVVSVDRARKTEENAKRMVENAYTVKKLLKFKERKKGQGPFLQFLQSSSRGAISVTV